MSLVLKEPDLMPDGGDHTIEVLIDLLIAEAEHRDPERGQARVALGVFDCVVHRAIDFDGQLQGHAEIVWKIRADGVLAAKGRAGLRAAKMWPEACFGARYIAAQFPGADGLTARAM